MLGQKSVFAIHKDAIKTYEEVDGRVTGRVMFTMSILSDVQEMVKAGMHPDNIYQELNEAKELLSSVVVRCDRLSKPKTATPEEKYAHEGGNHCPECGSGNITTCGLLQADADYAWQPVHCLDCKAEWTDEYKLTGFSRETTSLRG